MKNLPSELWKWDAVDLSEAIRSGVCSSREVVAACAGRMSQVNPAINAVVVDLTEQALAAADEADAALARGDAPGCLHGVPVTIKINVDQIGQATSNGVVAFSDVIASQDSPVVANLRHAGAIILGRTNTPAFSARWATDNALHGRTLNPWSRGHTPGGSSGGASASVAAGITPIGHGNDLAGSVRYPAYCTGIAGLRPSFGRIPAFVPSAKAERTLSLQWMSVQGPLARRVKDLRLALAAMSAFDPRDPWWVPAPLIGSPMAMPMRVAMAVDPAGTGVHPDVAQAVTEAGRRLRSAGYIVEEAELPDFAAIMDDWHVLSRAEASAFTNSTVHLHGDEGIRKTTAWHMEAGPMPTAVEYMQAVARRATWVRKWSLFMQRYPLILCPVSLQPPFEQGADVLSEDRFNEIITSQSPSFVVPVLGLPAASVPTGVSNGLPTGVQIIGRRFREDTVLEAAEVIEAHYDMPTPIDPRA